MKYVAFVALLILSSVAGSAEPTPDSFSSQFFDTLIRGDSDKAIDGFLGQNPLVKSKTQQLQLMKSQLRTAIELYGPPTAAELITKEELSPSLQRRVYITKHDYHPLSWEMYFYRGKGGWIPDQLIFLDQYQFLGPKK